MSAHQAGGYAAASRTTAEGRAGHLPDEVLKSHGQTFWREARVVIGFFALLTVGVLTLWYVWDEAYLDDYDLVYDLGLYGGILMLLQFLYAMRKHIASLRQWGNLKVWFLAHVVIGVLAPLIIILHSRFDIASINGGVAFFAMLLVVFSGIVGRYLYSKINFDFAGARLDLKSLHGELRQRVLVPNPTRSPVIEQQLKVFTVTAFAPLTGYAMALWQALFIGVRARWLFLQLNRGGETADASGGAHFNDASASLFLEPEKRVLKAYIYTVARIARYNAFKRLFALWRIAHVPVIYLLLVAGLAHVLAVHMY